MTLTNTSKKRFHLEIPDTALLRRGITNSITDITGVRVGHMTIWRGKNIRTGVTVIDPGIRDLYHNKIQAAIEVGNGYGKLAGITQVNELGTLETPIALTNTLAVGPVMRGIIDLVLGNEKLENTETINAIVGETNDGYLNDIHKNFISAVHVKNAWEDRKKEFAIGSVGAGHGTRAFSWKGGIGTASRIVPVGKKKYTVGVIAQTNFGGSLTIHGKQIGKAFGKSDFGSFLKTGDGSCNVVIATNAPLSSRQLGRIARRAFQGLGRTGSVMSHGSGDYAIAFSTNKKGRTAESDLTQFFLATVEATEESVLDAMWAATEIVGRGGNKLSPIDKKRVLKLLNDE